MSQHLGDLRVRRTQKLIREAFIALLEERSFEELTVGAIASRAMVSRTAFYRYYDDKYDLVMKLFEEMVTNMNTLASVFRSRAIDMLQTSTAPQSWAEIVHYTDEYVVPWEAFFTHIAEHERLYRALLGQRGSSWFVLNLRLYLAKITTERLQELSNGFSGYVSVPAGVLEDGFVSTQIAGLLINTIVWWLEQERPCTSRKIASSFFHMMSSILKDLPTWDESE